VDAFESLIASLLRHEGYWVTPSFKVKLTKEEKRKIETPTMPRLELDIVAYCGSKNEILVVECKSFLDSKGVQFNGFAGDDSGFTKRYKLFNRDEMRRIVFHRLKQQLLKIGACRPRPKIRLALAAGKIASIEQRQSLHEHFRRRNWTLFDEKWIVKRLRAAAEESYEDDVASVVSKILLRESREEGGSGEDTPKR
jgi:hypothetical protein